MRLAPLAAAALTVAVLGSRWRRLAVSGFFANGGRTCYVVRVGNPDWATRAGLDGEIARLTARWLRLWLAAAANEVLA